MVHRRLRELRLLAQGTKLLSGRDEIRAQAEPQGPLSTKWRVEEAGLLSPVPSPSRSIVIHLSTGTHLCFPWKEGSAAFALRCTLTSASTELCSLQAQPQSLHPSGSTRLPAPPTQCPLGIRVMTPTSLRVWKEIQRPVQPLVQGLALRKFSGNRHC